jgi:hypothetical protein
MLEMSSIHLNHFVVSYGFFSAFHLRLGSRFTQTRPAMYIRYMIAIIDTRIQDLFRIFYESHCLQQ